MSYEPTDYALDNRVTTVRLNKGETALGELDGRAEVLESDAQRNHLRSSVQYIDPGGSDANGGKSWGQPKLTLAAAVAALGSAGGSIFLTGALSEPAAVTIAKCVRLIALGAGVQPTAAETVLTFPAGSAGLTFSAAAQKSRVQDLVLASSTLKVATGTLTSGSDTVSSVVAVTGTIAAGHRIAGAGIPAGTTVLSVGAGTIRMSANASASASGVTVYGWSSAAGVGLTIKTHGLVADNVLVYGFGSHSVDIDSSAGDNANGFDLRDVRSFAAGGDGFKVHGNDSNAGTLFMCDASGSLGWGIDNASFGNAFYLPQLENNHSGAAKDSGSSCRWAWPYIEGPPSVGQNVDLSGASDYLWEGQSFGPATFTPAPGFGGTISHGRAIEKYLKLRNTIDGAAQTEWVWADGSYAPSALSLVDQTRGRNIFNVNSEAVLPTRMQMNVPLALPAYTTGGRPTAGNVPAGTGVYDSTLGKPIWSDGAAWRDAAGTAV